MSVHLYLRTREDWRNHPDGLVIAKRLREGDLTCITEAAAEIERLTAALADMRDQRDTAREERDEMEMTPASDAVFALYRRAQKFLEYNSDEAIDPEHFPDDEAEGLIAALAAMLSDHERSYTAALSRAEAQREEEWERAAKIAEAQRSENASPSWNDACALVADEIRTAALVIAGADGDRDKAEGN